MKKNNWTQKYSLHERTTLHKQFWDSLIPNAYPLTKGEVTLPISLDYFIIPKLTYIQLQKDLLHVIESSKKIVKRYYEDKSLQDFIQLRQEEKELIDKCENQSLEGIIRADVFYNPTTQNFQLVEINTDYPDGIFLHDITSNQINDLQKLPQELIHLKLFERQMYETGVNKSDTLGICWDKERFFIDEYEVTKILLKRSGWKNVFTGTIEELKEKEHHLALDGAKINYLRRGTELSKIRHNNDLLEKLISNPKTKIQNSFKMSLLGQKMLMAVLFEEKFRKIFTSEELKSIENLIPETRKLTKRILSKLLQEKDQWVVKLADGTEGADVIIGSSKSSKEWEVKLQNITNDSEVWIAQRKVYIPDDSFEVFDHKTQRITQLRGHYDICPHIFLQQNETHFGHTLIRFSSEEIVNVMQGGGITYAFPEK